VGEAVPFSLSTTGGDPTLGFVQRTGRRLRAGIVDVKALSGFGARAFLQFGERIRTVARAIGAAELELFGVAVINPRIEAMLIRHGFVPGETMIPEAFGGGTVPSLSKLFPVR